MANPVCLNHAVEHFDLIDLGFTLDNSEETLREVERVREHDALAPWRTRHLLFD